MGKKIIFITPIIFIIILSVISSSCQSNGKVTDKGEYRITNINIYKGTPVWELALAVRDQKTETIEKIAKG